MIKDFVPLADLEDLVFGGWDIFADNAYVAATRPASSTSTLEQLDDELGDQADAGRVRQGT